MRSSIALPIKLKDLKDRMWKPVSYPAVYRHGLKGTHAESHIVRWDDLDELTDFDNDTDSDENSTGSGNNASILS